MGKLSKIQVDVWDFEGYYQFKIYQIVDARKMTYYVGEPIGHGGTKLADTLEELRKKLEWEIPILNEFLARTK